MKTTRSPGFTVLEALIVVAIVAVLVALLFPLGQQFIKRSRSLQCIHNLKTLGAGLLLYTNDHNGKFPPTYETPHPGPEFGNNVPSWGPTWSEYIVKIYFNGDKTHLRCPSRPSDWAAKGYVGYYPDYGLNERVSPVNAITGYREGIRATAIKNPAKSILLGDVARYSGGKVVGGYYRIYTAGDLHPRHLESHTNVLYADSHAETHLLDLTNLPKNSDPLGLQSFILQ